MLKKLGEVIGFFLTFAPIVICGIGMLYTMYYMLWERYHARS